MYIIIIIRGGILAVSNTTGQGDMIAIESNHARVCVVVAAVGCCCFFARAHASGRACVSVCLSVSVSVRFFCVFFFVWLLFLKYKPN